VGVNHSEGTTEGRLGQGPSISSGATEPHLTKRRSIQPLCFHWSLSSGASNPTRVNACEPAGASQAPVNLCYLHVHKFTPSPALIPQPDSSGPYCLRKRIKIELEDEDGTKYTLALEGKVSRDKLMKAAEMLEIMDVPLESGRERLMDQSTFFGRIQGLIESAFASGDFSSSDVAREFEEKFSQPIRLSTVATYLSRLVEKDYLRREKFGNSWVYRRAYLKTGQLAER
jgi:Penicillinase repressor